MNKYFIDIDFIHLPLPAWLSAGALCLLLLILFLLQFRSLLPSRIAMFAALGLLCATPYMVKTTRIPLEPVAIVLVDQSPSMTIGDRTNQAQQAIDYLQEEASKQEFQLDRYEISGNAEYDTTISQELLKIWKRYDPARISAVFLITDGQISDAAAFKSWPQDGPPLHVMLTGLPNQRQASIEFSGLPDYAIMGDQIAVKLRANWNGNLGLKTAILSISNETRKWQRKIPLNEWTTIQLPFDHPGRNRFIFTLPLLKESILPATHTAAIDIPAIANHINILWHSSNSNISPWLQNLQKDPLIRIDNSGEDFSHYNILILDHPLTRPFPADQQQRLVSYLRQGGSVFLIQSSLPTEYITPELEALLPVTWADMPVTPAAFWWTPSAASHPVSADLVNAPLNLLSYSSAVAKSNKDSVTLISDENDNALLNLSRSSGGRIAYLTEPALLNGSPALTKRILAWLLRQPETDDEIIILNKIDQQLNIEYQGSDRDINKLYVTRPDLTTFEILLAARNTDLKTASFYLDQPGLYMISDGKEETAYLHGNLMNPEWQNATATAALLSPLVQKTGGRMIWLSQMPRPELRWVTTRQQGGKEWLPLREPRATASTGVTAYPLLPKFFLLLLIICTIAYAWWRETR